MRISTRETTLLLATAAVGLLGGSAILARPKIDEWKDLRLKQAQVAAQIQQDRKIVARREHWSQEFQKLSGMLPQYPADKKMDVYWLSIMDDLAHKHGVSISRREAGQEKQVGDLYELPLECQAWEARPDALVHFLFDLQNEGAMLDIRQLQIKPKEPRVDDTVRGSFSLSCAFTRAPAGGKK